MDQRILERNRCTTDYTVFKKCGISNEMDGTEDDMLWDGAEADDDNTHDNSDDEDVIYDDTLLREEMMDLFDSDSDEDGEFFGF